MKKHLFILLYFMMGTLMSQEKSIKVEKLPESIEEFEELRNQMGKTPEGGAVIFILASQIYVKNKEFGQQAFTVLFDSSEISKGDWYKGYEPSNSQKYFIKLLDSRPYLPFAYVQGATPEKGYKVSLPFEFIVSRNSHSGEENSGKVKVFMKTYGVMPRPITLTKNHKGIWKVKEASSIFVDVQPPKQEIQEDL